jgi:hypothetical protein
VDVHGGGDEEQRMAKQFYRMFGGTDVGAVEAKIIEWLADHPPDLVIQRSDTAITALPQNGPNAVVCIVSVWYTYANAKQPTDGDA